MRPIMQEKTFLLDNKNDFLLKALYYAQSFQDFVYLTGNEIETLYGSFNSTLAIGAKTKLQNSEEGGFAALQSLHQDHPNQTCFGYLSYDLKNEVEAVTSSNASTHDFPTIHFFIPEHTLHFSSNTVKIESFDPTLIFSKINHTQIKEENIQRSFNAVTSKTTKEKYIEVVNQLKEHILDGDIYEINYCIEYLVKNIQINPIQLFWKLNIVSPNPFSFLLKTGNNFALGASPERFIKKIGNKLISQPIKGTIKRGASDLEDAALKKQLRNSEKEQAENLMIVDLVRNDLARSAKVGSTKVEELFGIYSFKHLHQMVSTISCEVKNGATVECIKNAFPMGSMTGAPKVKAMELIERYETSKRGLFSGAVGYIDGNEDFDFNVVIRSMFYDANQQRLSFQVGSAITLDADAAMEYEECQLKAKGILQVLEGGF